MDFRGLNGSENHPERPRELKIVRWAADLGLAEGQMLGIDMQHRPAPIAQSNASGQGLVTNGQLGADIIQLDAGDGFVPHTHPGDHLLIVIGGKGTVTFDGKIYPTAAGEIYMIEGSVPHAVGAVTDHVIMAVGSPHKAVDAPDRMGVVDYQTVVSDIGELECLICGKSASYPQRLHDLGCTHCPCTQCKGPDREQGAHFARTRGLS